MFTGAPAYTYLAHRIQLPIIQIPIFTIFLQLEQVLQVLMLLFGSGEQDNILSMKQTPLGITLLAGQRQKNFNFACSLLKF